MEHELAPYKLSKNCESGFFTNILYLSRQIRKKKVKAYRRGLMPLKPGCICLLWLVISLVFSKILGTTGFSQRANQFPQLMNQDGLEQQCKDVQSVY